MVDLELCIDALRLQPELWHATQLASRARGKKIFPIVDIDALIEALRDHDGHHCKLEGVIFTAAHAKDYFPQVFFPIHDEIDLLKGLYAALLWGKSVHHLDAQKEFHTNAVSRKAVG